MNKQADPLEWRVIRSLAAPWTGPIKTGNVRRQSCPPAKKEGRGRPISHASDTRIK